MYKIISGIVIAIISISLYLFFGGEKQLKPEKAFLANSRVIQPLNNNWKFIKSAPADAHSLAQNQWKSVNLPHTWNAKDGQDGGGDYYRGTGTYFFYPTTRNNAVT